MHEKRQMRVEGHLGPFDKLFRVFMSVMLITSLVPVTPVNAMEGEGDNTEQGQAEAEAESETEGRVAGRSASESGGKGASKGESAQKTYPVTATITDYADGLTGTQPYSLIATINGKDYVSENTIAHLRVEADFGNDDEASLTIKTVGPDETMESEAVIMNHLSAFESIMLPQESDDKEYTTDDYYIYYDDNVIHPTYADGVNPIVVKAKPSVKASMTCNPANNDFADLVTVHVELTAKGYTDSLACTLEGTVEYDNGTKKDIVETTTITIDDITKPSNTGSFDIEIAKEMDALKSFYINKITYKYADEALQAEKNLNESITASKIYGYNTVRINGHPQVDSSKSTVTYSGNFVEKDEYTLVASGDVTATITVKGMNFTSTNAKETTYIKYGDSTEYPFTYVDANTLTAEVTLTDGDGYPSSYLLVNPPSGQVFYPSQKAIEFDHTAPTVSVAYEVGGGESASSDVDQDEKKQMDWFILPDDATLTVKLTASDEDGISASASTVRIDGNDRTLDSLAEEGGVYTIGTYKASDFFKNNTIMAKKLTFAIKDTFGNTQDTSEDGIVTYEFASDSYVLSLFAVELSAESEHAAAQRPKTNGTEDVYDSSVKVSVTTVTPDVWDGVKGYVNWDASKVEATGGALSVEEGKSLAENTYEATLSAEENANKDCSVTLSLKSIHGCTRNVTQSFSIDTTVPKYSATLAANNASFAEGDEDDQVYVFGKNRWPTIDLAVSSISTLPQTVEGKNEGLTVELITPDGTIKRDISDKVVWGKKDGRLFGSIDVESLGRDVAVNGTTPYRIAVSGINLFNQKAGNTATSQTFLIDHSAPEISVGFSGPVSILGLLARFFKSDSIIGSVTITVTDRSLHGLEKAPAEAHVYTSAGELTGVTWSEVNEDSPSSETRMTTLPYATKDANVVAIGESNNQTLRVTVTDRAGNTSEYTYDGATASIDGKTGQASGNEFVVDVSSVRIEGFEIAQSTVDTTRFGQAIKVASGVTGTEVAVRVSDENFDAAKSTMTITKYVDGIKVDETSNLATTWTTTDGNNEYIGTATVNALDYANEDALRSSVVTFAIGLVANDTLVNAKTTNDLLGEAYIGFDACKPEVRVRVDAASIGHDKEGIVTDCYDADQVHVTFEVVDPYLDATAGKIVRKNARGNDASSSLSFTETNMHNVFVAVASFDENAAGVIYDDLAVTVNDVTKEHEVTACYGPDTTTYKDGDAWKSVAGSQFIVDAHAPRVDVSFDQTWVCYDDNEGADYFESTDSTQPLTATITVEDNNFDPAMVELNTYKGDATIAQDWTPGKKGTWRAKLQYDETIGFEGYTLGTGVNPLPVVDMLGDAHKTAYAYANNKDNKTTRATDANGNEKTLKGTSFIYDSTKPTIKKVEFSSLPVDEKPSDEDGKDYYDAEVAVTVVVEDNNLDIAGTKINGTSYTTWQQDEKTWTLTGITFAENENYGSDYGMIIDVADMIGNTASWNYKDGKKNGSVDATGAERFVVDTTTPRIGVEFDREPTSSLPAEGSTKARDYYNDNVRVTLTVEDLNLSDASIEAIDARISKLEKAASVSVVQPLTQDSKNKAMYTAVLAFGENTAGTAYDLGTFDAYDRVWKLDNSKLEHTASVTHGSPFFVQKVVHKTYPKVDEVPEQRGVKRVANLNEPTTDKTSPKIVSITYDNNDVSNGKYYKAARTATVTVEEHNWDEARQGSFITSNGVIGDWSHKGDIHTATVLFATDGDCNLSVCITDKAGNSVSRTEPEFTVDLTAPIIKNLHVEEDRLSSENVRIVFNATDNIGLDSVEYTVGDITGTLYQDKTSEYSFEVPSDFFGHEQVTILAKDLAGNLSDDTIEGDSNADFKESQVLANQVTKRDGIWRYLPIIAVGVVVVGLAVFFVWRKRHA